MRNRAAGQRGSGLVLSLISLTVLTLLSATAYRLTRTQVRESVWTLRQAQARAIAETGLDDALYRLSRDTTWREGAANRPCGGGSYTVTVSTDEPPWIEATGYSEPIVLLGPAVITVRAKAEYAWDKSLLVHAGWKRDSFALSYKRQ